MLPAESPRALVECCERAAALRAEGQLAEAADEWRRALVMAPRHPVVLNNYGLTLIDDERYDAAITVLEQAASVMSGATPLVNLGDALRASGRKQDAIAAYRTAIEREPNAAAYFNMHATRYDDPTRAIETLALALECQPDHVEARFFLSTLLHDKGLLATLPDECAFMVDSYRFTREHSAAKHFGDTFDLLRYAIDQAEVEGDVIELGVRRGTTTRFLASLCPHVHGFESEESPPEVPGNVTLHVGLSEETLPKWTGERPLRLLHLNCNVYSSAAEGLDHLARFIIPGTVVVFDKYLCDPRWRDEEHGAWVEAAVRDGWSYEYLAFSLFTKQAALIVVEEERSTWLF